MTPLLALHVLVALLRQRTRAPSPDELANAWLWVDRAVWARTGDGLVPEQPVLSAVGLDTPFLAPLRQGKLPDAWTPYLMLDQGHVHLTPTGQQIDLDELSRFIEGEIEAVPQDAGPLADLPELLGEKLRQAGYGENQRIAIADVFRTLGFPEGRITALTEQWQEWRAIDAAFASMGMGRG